MSFSLPTRLAAYGLLVTASGREEWTTFSSLELLAVELARRAPGGEGENRWARVPSRHREFKTSFSVCGTCLSVSNETSVQVAHSRWGATVAVRVNTFTLEAFGLNGRQLKIAGILDLGGSILRARRNREPWSREAGASQSYRGCGPVKGISKWRGGGGYYRHMSTASDMRLNALVLTEDGEVSARTSRCGTNLPSAWDDYHIRRETGWKDQHKGHKSWDRQRTLSKVAKAERARASA